MDSKIEKISEHCFAATMEDGRVFTLSNRGSMGAPSDHYALDQTAYDLMPYSIGDAKLIPYGVDNLLPSHLRDIIDNNNLAPGVLERQMGLIYGQGPELCRKSYTTEGEIRRAWVDNYEIRSWLESWDYTSFIKGALSDYLYLKGFFNAWYLEKGSRIGMAPRIGSLEHIPAKNARLEWTDTRSLKDVEHIYVGNFESRCTDTGLRSYPVFDPKAPGKFRASASYNRTASFGRDFYAMPQYYGALRWISRGSEIPTIFKYVTDNGLNLAYHVHSPQAYWDVRRDVLRTLHPDWNEAKVEAEISKATTEFLENLTKVLSGKENAGKFFHTVDVLDDTGKPVTWSIEPIDQKIKDFVDSQLKISDASVSAITSGMGLHPSLSNIMVNGKLASGSELLYAFKLFLLSDTRIASSVVLGPINTAIAINFPNSGVYLDFYHSALLAEEAISEKDRIKNQ